MSFSTLLQYLVRLKPKMLLLDIWAMVQYWPSLRLIWVHFTTYLSKEILVLLKLQLEEKMQINRLTPLNLFSILFICLLNGSTTPSTSISLHYLSFSFLWWKFFMKKSKMKKFENDESKYLKILYKNYLKIKQNQYLFDLSNK